RLLVCGDDDRWKGRNTGAEAAQQAAEAVQADYVLPDFTGLDQSGQPTDFDDLRQLAGDDAVKKQIGEVLHREPETAVRCIGIDDFLVKSYPPRVNLLAPWLQNPGLAMIYAWRGVGKTHVAMRVAYAVASGGRYLDWVAPQPQPVLYLDGEMPAVVMQERLRQLVTSSDREPPPGFFNLITLDEQGAKGMPNLSTLDGQRALEPYTQKAKLIIVDNISTLARSGEENSSDDWLAMQQWCLRMRSEGRTVLLIHHAGKGGAQRGTSRREDVLDTVISLKRPSDYEEAQGARFEIHFEKARGIFGDDVKPIEAQLESLPDGGERWSVMALEASTYDRVVDLTGLGMSQTEIARELGINRSNVSRNIRKARECGDLSHKNNAKEA
nr:AAA family ATPase [Thiolinea sp.]